MRKMALGGGGRFAAVAKSAEAHGAKNGAAIAAIAGRKKYGQEAMTRMAVAGKKRKKKKKGM